MLLSSRPLHLVTLSQSSSTKDAAGGEVLSYTTVQAACPCLINTASSATKDLFAQKAMTVTHTIGIKSVNLTTTPKPGWKATADDTGSTYAIHGISSGRANSIVGIPALTYLHCEELL